MCTLQVVCSTPLADCYRLIDCDALIVHLSCMAKVIELTIFV